MDRSNKEIARRKPRKRSNSASLKRVLFVDDDPILRSTFARTLGARGFLVDVASNATEALALAADVTYAVIATDLSMPGEDGISLIRQLLRKNQSTVFVIVTGRADVEVPTEPEFRDRVMSIIAKPWDTDQLVETLHRSTRVSQSRGSILPARDIAGPKNRILLLEDDDADAHLIEAYLRLASTGAEVTRASRLSEALKYLDTQSFGTIISDLTLPDARGLDAVLRIQNAAGDTPLLVMSGVEDETVAVQAVQAGAQDYLVKGSVDPAGLNRSIQYAQQRKRAELNLTRLAHFDPLTGLANRTHFRERLDHTLARARRTGEPFAVLFLDLDDFKPVNDELGHAAGDELLVEVSRRLEAAVREYDMVARLGGDEFAIVLDALSDSAEGILIAERILAAVSKPHPVTNGIAQVSASIGIASYPDAADSAADLLKAADVAMYAAKRRGRNTYEIFQRSRRSSIPLVQVCPELKHALSQGELSLYYQPLHDLRRRRIVAAEGILCWQGKAQVNVSPHDFLPLLEQSSEIRSIGAWVILSACRELRGWQEQGVHLSRVSVRVSARQLDGNDLVHTVRHALSRTGLEPRCLELEVAESSVMKDPLRAKRVLSEFKDMGVRISLGDLGMHSSLMSPYQLPIDVLKLAGSLIVDLANEQCRSVASKVIRLAKEMGQEVVAGGVETEEQKDFLESEGCDILQGTLFGPAMSVDDFGRLVGGPAARDSAKGWQATRDNGVHRDIPPMGSRRTIPSTSDLRNGSDG